MVMKPYGKTDNAKLLESILEKGLIEFNLLKKDVAEIALGKRLNEKTLRVQSLIWCESSIEDYISITGAIARGEFRITASKILTTDSLHVAPWQLEQYLLKTSVKLDVQKINFNRLLLQYDIHAQKLGLIIESFDHPVKMKYPDINKVNNLVYFNDIKMLTKYTEEFLTDPDESIIGLEKFMMRKKVKERRYRSINSIKWTLEEKERNQATQTYPTIVDTLQLFASKYGFDNKDNVKQSRIEYDIERSLVIFNLTNTEYIRSIKSMILRIPAFSDILKVPGSHDYSREKFKSLALIYVEGTEEEIEEFKTDFANTFETKVLNKE
jgi:hypothetical protein